MALDVTRTTGLAATHEAWLRDILERGDRTGLKGWFSAAHRLHQSVTEASFALGPRGIDAAVRSVEKLFHPWLVHIADQIETETRVCTRFVATGKHVGAIGPLLPTGVWMPITGMMVSRFADGLAYETWIEVNMFDALRRANALRAAVGRPTVGEQDNGDAQTSETA